MRKKPSLVSAKYSMPMHYIIIRGMQFWLDFWLGRTSIQLQHELTLLLLPHTESVT